MTLTLIILLRVNRMICWFEHSSNDIARNEKMVFLLSSYSSSRSSVCVYKENFREFIALSASKGREVIGRSKWYIINDPYFKPIGDK